jgi:predicted Rossmann fold flavoprotein
MTIIHEQYDVAVIGGGPAGMLAAGRAAELGARTVLIDKNKSLGKKLLMSGGGRCNITQATFDAKEFTPRLGKNGRFLYSSFSMFGPREIISFLYKKGVRTKEEIKGRVFPTSGQAQDVLSALLGYLREHRVTMLLGKDVTGFDLKDGAISQIRLSDRTIEASSIIIATGGKSYPNTGSTGDGYVWAKEFGHSIISPLPALVPIQVGEGWINELQGLSLKNIQINVYQNNKKKAERFGEMLFTHFGLSGPIILDVSKEIGALLPSGGVSLEIDLKPALDIVQLDQRRFCRTP